MLGRFLPVLQDVTNFVEQMVVKVLSIELFQL
jgi:hypothetical protein